MYNFSEKLLKSWGKKLFVIQSEAKDLENIHFKLRYVTEILRR